jgi:hypothetical protein
MTAFELYMTFTAGFAGALILHYLDIVVNKKEVR